MSRIKIIKCPACDGKSPAKREQLKKDKGEIHEFCHTCLDKGKLYIDRLYPDVVMQWHRQRNRLKTR